MKYCLPFSPIITLAPCNSLNPTTLPSSRQGDNSDDCVTLPNHLPTPRADLQGAPLIMLIQFGLQMDEQGHYRAGYATILIVEIIESLCLPDTKSTQKAKLIALIRAYQLVKDQIANIYTDRCFRVAHDFRMLWKQRGFLTSYSQPIKNGQLVSKLLDLMQLPTQLSIIKIPGHSSSGSVETKGSQLADPAAKQVALSLVPVQFQECLLLKHNSDETAKKFLLQAQELASENEKQAWR